MQYYRNDLDARTPCSSISNCHVNLPESRVHQMSYYYVNLAFRFTQKLPRAPRGGVDNTRIGAGRGRGSLALVPNIYDPLNSNGACPPF